MSYKWKPGISTRGVNANVAGTHIEKLLKKGIDILADAKSPKSPIHDLFDWEDSEAAKSWREHQARLIQNHLIIVEVQGEIVKHSPAFFNVVVDGSRQYVPRETVINSPSLQEQVLNNALRDAKMFQSKYKHLSEFFKFFGELENFIEQVSAKVSVAA